MPGMPNFNVIYRFTCPTCAHPNEGETDVEAADKVGAYHVAFEQVRCTVCISKLQQITSSRAFARFSVE